MKLLKAVRVRGVRVGDEVSRINRDEFRRVIKVKGGDCNAWLDYEDGGHDSFSRLTGWGVDIRRPAGPELKWVNRGFGTYWAEITADGEWPSRWYSVQGSTSRGYHVYLYEADGQGNREKLWSDYGPGITYLKARAAEHYQAALQEGDE
jgi:hypothetical protein